MIKNYILVLILTIIVLASLVYGFMESGSPFDARGRKFDNQRVSDISTLSSGIQNYYYSKYALPTKLSDLEENYYAKNFKDPETGKDYRYQVTSGNSYKICTTFSFDSTFDEKGMENTYLGYPVNKFKHPKGDHCFDLNVEAISNRPLEPMKENSASNKISGSAATSCSTFGTLMIVEKGKGTIGCDINVSGSFDLSKSYCEGQKTHKKQFLVQDSMGRENRYFATLNGLDPAEEVKVYIYSNSGKQIECTPSLNQSE